MVESNTKTLLLVDDEPYTLEALKRVFKDEPYRILTSETASEALEIMAKESVELIITDYNMKGMNGTDLLKEIHTTWPNTIRILLTGQIHIQTIMLAVNRDIVYKFITKPWDSDDLVITVRRAMDHLELKSWSPD